MPRKVEITLPSHQTDELIPDIKQLKGMIGLRLQRNASIHPPGDAIIVEITNRGVNRLLRLLDQQGVGHGSSSSIADVVLRAAENPVLNQQPTGKVDRAG